MKKILMMAATSLFCMTASAQYPQLTDEAAKLISESIKQGGAYGQRILALFGKVITSLNDNLADCEVKDWSILRDNQQKETPKAFRR